MRTLRVEPASGHDGNRDLRIRCFPLRAISTGFVNSCVSETHSNPHPIRLVHRQRRTSLLLALTSRRPSVSFFCCVTGCYFVRVEQVADEHNTREAPRPGNTSAGLVLVGISASLWWPAFTLGAWGTLFFDQLLGVWAATTSCLVIVLIQARPYPGRFWKAAALSVPSLWLALSFFSPTDSASTQELIADLVGILVALLGLPFAIWVVTQLLWPGFGDDLSRPRRVALFLAALGILGIAFTLGLFQEGFLTCDDFSISGNSNPPHCTPGP